MIRTVELSPYIQAQGRVTADLPEGKVRIVVDEREYVGRPIATRAPAEDQALA